MCHKLNDVGIGQMADPPIPCASPRDPDLEDRLHDAVQLLLRAGVTIGRAKFTQSVLDYAQAGVLAACAAHACELLAAEARRLAARARASAPGHSGQAEGVTS